MTSVSKRSEKIFKEVYYDKGVTLGRDGLFEYLKQNFPKTYPTRREVMSWLKQQELHQKYTGQKSGGTADFFRPLSPASNVFSSLNFLLILLS